METTPRRKALGIGLNELFNAEVLDINELEEKIVNETPKEEIIEINLDELRSNPYQPRQVFDEKSLNELADSIKEHGVFQPIIVKKSVKGYEIIAGERRVKASKIAGKSTIPAIVREFNDTEMMEIALLENLQRENLNPIEEATAYVKIMQVKGLTQEEFAKAIGKSQGYVNNMIGILRLPDNVKQMVIEGKLSMTHARTLSKMSDYDQIISLANKVIDEKLSSHELEALASNDNIQKKVKVERNKSNNNSEYHYIEELICNRIGCKVKISNNKVEIKYNDINDLNRLLEALNIKETEI